MKIQDVLNRSTVTLFALVLLLGVLLTARALTPQESLPAAKSVQIKQENVMTQTDGTNAEEGTGDFFKDFRAQREQARKDELALLDGIVNRQGAPEQSVKEADQRKIEITKATEQERMMEKLLIAKGFEDAAAFSAEDIVTIVVKKAELSEADTAKIMDIAIKYTDFSEDQIKIVPVAP